MTQNPRTPQKWESAHSLEALELCLKYSEEKEALEKLLQEVKVFYLFDGPPRKYFPTDEKEEPRQVLLIKIVRGTREIGFTYGMSIRDTEILHLSNNDISFHSFVKAGGIRWSRNPIIKRGEKSLLQLRDEKKRIKESILYNILYSCRGDFYCSKDFDDFCADYGYNTDSRKAEETWKACLKQSALLEKIFRENEIPCLPS